MISLIKIIVNAFFVNNHENSISNVTNSKQLEYCYSHS
jgi:hypothetical protein